MLWPVPWTIWPMFFSVYDVKPDRQLLLKRLFKEQYLFIFLLNFLIRSTMRKLLNYEVYAITGLITPFLGFLCAITRLKTPHLGGPYGRTGLKTPYLGDLFRWRLTNNSFLGVTWPKTGFFFFKLLFQEHDDEEPDWTGVPGCRHGAAAHWTQGMLFNRVGDLT